MRLVALPKPKSSVADYTGCEIQSLSLLKQQLYCFSWGGSSAQTQGLLPSEFSMVRVSSVGSPCLVPTAAGASTRRVEVRGNFLVTESIWDVGAGAKQTSLFLKFIPSLASGHKWVINIICISKLSCKHAHRQDTVCHKQYEWVSRLLVCTLHIIFFLVFFFFFPSSLILFPKA